MGNNFGSLGSGDTKFNHSDPQKACRWEKPLIMSGNTVVIQHGQRVIDKMELYTRQRGVKELYAGGAGKSCMRRCMSKVTNL